MNTGEDLFYIKFKESMFTTYDEEDQANKCTSACMKVPVCFVISLNIYHQWKQIHWEKERLIITIISHST